MPSRCADGTRAELKTILPVSMFEMTRGGRYLADRSARRHHVAPAFTATECVGLSMRDY
jgi:hypothetical protein